MAKSKFFLLISLIFLLSDFIWLKFFGLFELDVFYLWLLFVLFFSLSIWRRSFSILLMVILSALRVYYFVQPEKLAHKNFTYGEKYVFSAKIIDIDKRLNGWQLIVRPVDLKNLPGKILVYAPLYPEYNANDRIEIACRLFAPEAIEVGVGRFFAYDKYLAKDNILATCPAAVIKYQKQDKSPLDFLLIGKRYFLGNLDRYLTDPSSAFAKAIILDGRQEMPDYLTPAFSRTGLTHVISISGLHMVVIIWFFHWLLQLFGLKRQHIFWALLLVLFAYLYLIGFISPALRSTAMIIMVLLGPLLGRPAISGYSLLFLADIFVFLNPYILMYDLSFQLSFTATLGLILYVSWFKKKLQRLTNRLGIREVLSVTLAAQIFTWPLVVYYFHIFSLVSPLANFLVLPLFPPILILSLGVAILGRFYILGQILAWPLVLLIKIMFWLVDFLGKLPGSYFEIGDFSQVYFWSSCLFMIIITLLIKPYEQSSD